VARLDLNAPVDCNSVPADGLSEMLDAFQLWSSLGYAWEMTGDNAFLQKASHMIGARCSRRCSPTASTTSRTARPCSPRCRE